MDNSIKIILSIILGFGLAFIFRLVCLKRNCIIYKEPNPNEIAKKIYMKNNKCYKLKPINTKCSNNN